MAACTSRKKKSPPTEDQIAIKKSQGKEGSIQLKTQIKWQPGEHPMLTICKDSDSQTPEQAKDPTKSPLQELADRETFKLVSNSLLKFNIVLSIFHNSLLKLILARFHAKYRKMWN